MIDWLARLTDVHAQLPQDGTALRYCEALRHGSMRLGLYAPHGQDMQTAHSQDEIYVVVCGHGRFTKDGDTRPFRAQDVLFVEAGADHRFVEFSEDFAAWVIFWGPKGGETQP